MTICGLCERKALKKNDIYLVKIGKPPILMSDILLKIVFDVEHNFASNALCQKCTNKLLQYYNASQVMEKIRAEILDFVQNLNATDKSINEDNKIKEEIDSASEVETIETTFMVQPKEEELAFKEDILDIPQTELCAWEMNPLADDHNKQEIANDTKNSTAELETTNCAILLMEDEIKQENKNCEKKSKTATKIEKEMAVDKKLKVKKTKSIAVRETVETAKNSIDCTKSKGIFLYPSSGIGQPISITCELCDRSFEHPSTFKAHKKYTDFAGYICESCGITCLSQSGFKAHTKSHRTEREFKCTECGEQFHRINKLNHHMAWHKGEKPFQCEICAKCFVHRIALKRHQVIHSEETRRIECTQCDKKFRTLSHLRRHMAIHTGAKPFSCPICGKFFSQSYNRKAHMKQHEEPRDDKKKKRC